MIWLFDDVDGDFIVTDCSFAVDMDAAARGQFGEQDADAGVGRKNIEEGIAWIGR